jgi:hypothetical protein
MPLVAAVVAVAAERAVQVAQVLSELTEGLALIIEPVREAMQVRAVAEQVEQEEAVAILWLLAESHSPEVQAATATNTALGDREEEEEEEGEAGTPRHPEQVEAKPVTMEEAAVAVVVEMHSVVAVVLLEEAQEQGLSQSRTHRSIRQLLQHAHQTADYISEAIRLH